MSKLLEQIHKGQTVNLEEVCHYVFDRIDVSELSLDNYISTENMVSERGGIEKANGLPDSGRVVKFEIGDTLTSNIRPYFKKIWRATKSGGCSNDVLVFRPNNKSELDQSFLYYTLSNDTFFAYSMMTSRGTKMPRGDKDGIMKYKISFPELPIQKKIAGILGAYDAKIENNNKEIKELEELAQIIFKERFVSFRFPGWEKLKMVDSEIGDIPEGWRVGKIDDIVERLSTQKTYKEDSLFKKGSVPVYDQSSKGIIGFHNEEPFFDADINNPILIFGDHTCRTQLIIEPFSLGPNTIPLREKNGYSPLFTYFLTKNSVEQREYKRHWNELSNIQFIIPSIKQVKDFVSMVQSFVENMFLLEKENIKLKESRDQLLAKLI